MSELPGQIKPLVLNLPEMPNRDTPKLSHIPHVQQLTEKHKWVVSALGRGFKPSEVADMFGLDVGYVRQIGNWDHPVLEMIRQRAADDVAAGIEDLGQRFRFHAEEALNKTVSIMRTADPSNARLAAKDLLDRAGYAPVKKVAEVSVAVPSQEFVQAVERMTAADQAQDGMSKWAWQPPVQTVEAP